MSNSMVGHDTAPVAARYKPIVVTIHWLAALLVLVQIAIGLNFADMPKGAARMDAFAWHTTVGVLILLLALVRIAIRLMNSPPPYPHALPGWERVAARWSHALFYFFLVALPLTGLAAASENAVGGMADLQFGLRFPVIPLPALGDTHVVLVWSMVALLVIHVGAALEQQFFSRTTLAGRMPPFRPRRTSRD